MKEKKKTRKILARELEIEPIFENDLSEIEISQAEQLGLLLLKTEIFLKSNEKYLNKLKKEFKKLLI